VIIGKDHVGNKEILRAIAKKDNGQEFLLRLFTLAGDVAQSHNLAPQCVILYGIFDVHLPQSLEVLQKEAEETLPIVEAAESIGVRSTAIFWGGDAGEEAKLYEGTPPPMVMEYTAAWADQTSSQYITLTSMKQELERRTSDAVPTRTTEEVDEKTGDIATHRVLDIAGSEPVDLAKTVVFMKKDLAEGFIREGHTGDVILAQEYKKMKQELRRLFNNRDQAIVEVATTEELVDGANAAMQGGDIKVIILDDGALTEKMPAGAIQGKAGEAYCVVRADSSRFSRDKGLVQFVNLHAMVMMGVGILNRDEWLFQSAYQTFTGKKAPQGLLEKMQQGALWIVRALPRMVRLTDTMRDSEILQRLFAVAA
jgi:hypothetical protein